MWLAMVKGVVVRTYPRSSSAAHASSLPQYYPRPRHRRRPVHQHGHHCPVPCHRYCHHRRALRAPWSMPIVTNVWRGLLRQYTQPHTGTQVMGRWADYQIKQTTKHFTGLCLCDVLEELSLQHTDARGLASACNTILVVSHIMGVNFFSFFF